MPAADHRSPADQPPAIRLPASERALARPRRRFPAALAALAALAAVGLVTGLGLGTPSPAGLDAQADEFSADRAYRHLRTIAAEPHAAGSPAADRVRSYLESTLRGLGLTPELQDTVAEEAGQLRGGAGGATLARVRNVVARIPGTDPTGRVFLVAHYDSVQVGPGGNDDGAGTSALLEVARALTVGERPRNDVVLVFTDAEEACLCGASAFAADHPLAADGGVVLNLEARGSTGPVIMFETSLRNAGLVEVFGRAAPYPTGTSFAVEVYRLLPNDTDFTAFLDHGFTGLNAAYIDGAALYHTPLDTPANVDRGSLQQHGANTLGLAREFGAIDLTRLDAAGDATYFPLPGGLARYPGWLTLPLALLALAGVGVLGWAVRRRGRASWPRLAAGFGLALLPIVLAPLGAQLLWAGVTAIRPGYATLLDPYRPFWYRLAVVALAAAVLFGWYALTRRRTGPAALAVGGLGWLAVLGVLLAAVAPGGAYLTTLPALAGVLAGLAALAVPRNGPWPVVAVTAGAAVGVLVLLPTVVLLFPALGMAMGGVGALFAVLLGLAALPVLDLLHPAAGGQRGIAALRARRRGALPALAALLGAVACTGTGLVVDRFDAAHPVPTHLMYALDTDTGTARWLSEETDPQPWTARYVDGPTRVGDTFPVFGDEVLRAGPAEPAALPPPRLDPIADVTDSGVRTLRVRLVPQRPVRFAALHVDPATATVVSARVAGRQVRVDGPEVRGDDGPAADREPFGVVFHAPPAEGFEIELRLRPAGDAPVRLRAMDASDGLAGLPGFRPRPPGVGIVGSHSSELVAVARTYPF
ncbi:M28 family peptidase [Plantactinospora sp. B6F1]|uniref:M28 family peptidase n=1 Tax=Plantactinospora sp. B6F1 TaxID=3158971 RepID=UPI0032D93C4E